MTLQREYFARLYRTSDDPWKLQERWYEQRKRQLTLAALNKPRYACAFEPGCSIGELSAGLSARCDALLVADLDPTACETARQRLEHLSHVRVEQRTVPQEWPDMSFDLIVISELAYYFEESDLAILADCALNSLMPGGTLLACHWRHPVPDYPQTGDSVHDILARQLRLKRLLHHEEEDFLLDVWSDDERSVARTEGLV